MPKIRVRDVQLYYEISGTGEYLLQVGGAVNGHEGYAAVTPEMSRHFTVIDFDHRGYGQSERPAQKYTFDVWADDMAALMDALRITRSHVHGGSMGSTLAAHYAAKFPNRVRGLVLSGCTAKSDVMAKFQYEVWKALARAYGIGSRELAIELVTKGYSRRFLDELPDPMEFVHQTQLAAEHNVSADVFCDACDALSGTDVLDRLPSITAPTLVIVGDEDILTPANQGPSGAGGRLIYERLVNALFKEYVVVSPCGHGNLFERPVESNKAVVDFLKRVETELPT